jgi:hypothetical protein
MFFAAFVAFYVNTNDPSTGWPVLNASDLLCVQSSVRVKSIQDVESLMRQNLRWKQSIPSRLCQPIWRVVPRFLWFSAKSRNPSHAVPNTHRSEKHGDTWKRISRKTFPLPNSGRLFPSALVISRAYLGDIRLFIPMRTWSAFVSAMCRHYSITATRSLQPRQRQDLLTRVI